MNLLRKNLNYTNSKQKMAALMLYQQGKIFSNNSKLMC